MEIVVIVLGALRFVRYYGLFGFNTFGWFFVELLSARYLGVFACALAVF